MMQLRNGTDDAMRIGLMMQLWIGLMMQMRNGTDDAIAEWTDVAMWNGRMMPCGMDG